MTTDAQIIEEYRAAFRRLAGSGVIDMDKHLRRHFNFQIHRLEDMIMAFDGEIPPIRQSQFFLNLTTKGSGEKTIGGASIPIRRNTLFAIPSRMIQASKYWPGDCAGYFLGFNLEFFLSGTFPAHLLANKSLFRHASSHYLLLTNAQVRKLTSLYETLIDENSHRRSHRNEVLVLKVLELVIACDRLFSQAAPAAPQSDRSDVLDRFDDLIREHHGRERTVAFYARSLHMHPNHLNSVVKRSTGLTAKATIMGFIVGEARHLLCSTSMSIKEIAFQLGFNDPNQLSALFRRHFHVSPRQFKRGPHCF
jgi:AraC family transcriptional activator of pobA